MCIYVVQGEVGGIPMHQYVCIVCVCLSVLILQFQGVNSDKCAKSEFI